MAHWRMADDSSFDRLHRRIHPVVGCVREQAPGRVCTEADLNAGKRSIKCPQLISNFN